MEDVTVTLHELGEGDDELVLGAGELFDTAPSAAWTARFLTAPGHHLILAADAAGGPVGFVTGVEMTHPDKGTEMFLYELGVAEEARGRGVGRRLVEHLEAVARREGCYGMWTLAEHDNVPALATYRAAGAVAEPGTTTLVWHWRGGVP